jgi:drug/metabolite transporter (DMT)-like permease
MISYMLSLVVVLYATWSTVFAFGKVMLGFAPPVFLTGSRMLAAGALMCGYLLWKKRSAFKMNARQWLSIGFLAVFSIYLTNILEFWGLQYLSAAKACFIYSLSPFFAALFSYFHFKEKMTPMKWLGLLIGFCGIVPVLMIQTGSEELFQLTTFLTWPTLAIIGAALFSVYGWVMLRTVVKNHDISPMTANGTSMLIGGAIALITSLFVDGWTPTPVAAGKALPFLAGTGAMMILYNVICYNLYGWLLKRYTATFLSFMGLLSPIFASLSGWLFLGESPSWQIFLATGIVSIGLFVVYRAELKQGYIVKKAPAEQRSAEVN